MPMLMSALAAQLWKARRISPSHTVVGAILFSVWNSVLAPPPGMLVPSGAKLRVRWVESAQGTPNSAGHVRSSNSSTPRGRESFLMVCLPYALQGGEGEARGTNSGFFRECYRSAVQGGQGASST